MKRSYAIRILANQYFQITYLTRKAARETSVPPREFPRRKGSLFFSGICSGLGQFQGGLREESQRHRIVKRYGREDAHLRAREWRRTPFPSGRGGLGHLQKFNVSENEFSGIRVVICTSRMLPRISGKFAKSGLNSYWRPLFIFNHWQRQHRRFGSRMGTRGIGC